MRVHVLGCSGGIGDGRHTTSFLVDEDILLDAGSGLTRLSLESLEKIDHIFLTHAHMDHVLALPPMLDSVVGRRNKAITLHAIPEVLEVLKEHMFNWHLWPDFTTIPSPEQPTLCYSPIEVGKPVFLGARSITPIPANHVVPTVGYLLRGEHGSLLFSGDTCGHDALWQAAIEATDLKHLIVECSFPNAMREIADAAKHFCPETLSAELGHLQLGVPVWITHMKPGSEVDIIVELDDMVNRRVVQTMREGHIFEI